MFFHNWRSSLKFNSGVKLTPEKQPKQQINFPSLPPLFLSLTSFHGITSKFKQSKPLTWFLTTSWSSTMAHFSPELFYNVWQLLRFWQSLRLESPTTPMDAQTKPRWIRISPQSPLYHLLSSQCNFTVFCGTRSWSRRQSIFPDWLERVSLRGAADLCCGRHRTIMDVYADWSVDFRIWRGKFGSGAESIGYRMVFGTRIGLGDWIDTEYCQDRNCV